MDNIEPVSRIEQYLDRMANGGSGDLPTPVSRIEQYLNQIALGGGSGGGGGGGSDTVILHLDFDTWAFDKTWNEIKTALASGKRVIYPFGDDEDGVYGQMNVVQLSQADGDYVVHLAQVFEDKMVVSTAHCTSADEYPVFG